MIIDETTLKEQGWGEFNPSEFFKEFFTDYGYFLATIVKVSDLHPRRWSVKITSHKGLFGMLMVDTFEQIEGLIQLLK